MSYVIPPLTEQWHSGGFLVSRAEGHLSMERVTITGGAKLYPGTVLGQQTVAGDSSATAAPLGANTGNGTFSAIGVTPGTAPGVFTVEFADATHFVVSAPDGTEIGHGVTGAAFNAGGIGFSIAAGSTPFAPADSFAVTVATSAPSMKYVPATATATDGSQNAAAILWGVADASRGDVQAAVVVRNAEYNLSEILWDPSMDAPHQAVAIAQLTRLGLIAR